MQNHITQICSLHEHFLQVYKCFANIGECHSPIKLVSCWQLIGSSNLSSFFNCWGISFMSCLWWNYTFCKRISKHVIAKDHTCTWKGHGIWARLSFLASYLDFLYLKFALNFHFGSIIINQFDIKMLRIHLLSTINGHGA